MDAIRAYHTMSANLASVEELSLSLMSFVEETTASAEMLEDHAIQSESMPPEMDTNINVAHNDRQEPHLSDGLVGGKLEGEESWQWKPNHYSDVGAFGMTLPIADKGGVRALWKRCWRWRFRRGTGRFSAFVCRYEWWCAPHNRGCQRCRRRAISIYHACKSGQWS